jgi:K+-sensing histidine kinase KdpD
MEIILVENWEIGIAADQMENIFNKFVRDERIDRFRAIRGLGLGLYVARLIAKVH